MKCTFLAIGIGVLSLMSSCTGSDKVAVGQKTTMVVNPVFDAGWVVKGEIIKAKFIVKNTGDYPLVIAEAKPSCSCTIASKPEDPILPGKTGVISAHVDTDKTTLSIISKTVRIVANTEPGTTEVLIKARVRNK
jgi:hypothetical protein